MVAINPHSPGSGPAYHNQDPSGGGGVYVRGRKPSSNPPDWATPKNGNSGLKGYTFAKSAAAANRANGIGGGGGGGGGGTNPSPTTGTSGITRANTRQTRQRNTGGSAHGMNLYKQAKRDVMLSLHPVMQQYKRQGMLANQAEQQQLSQTQNIYGALGTQLAGLADPYQQQISGISGDLAGNLATLSGSLNGQLGQAPPAEKAAAAGLFGAIGSGGLEMLSSGAARNAAYNTSAQRQGVEQSAVDQRNAVISLANYMRDLGQQRSDTMSQTPQQILSRLDALKQQAASLAASRSGNKLNWAQFNQSTSQQNIANQTYAQWLKIMQGGGN